MNKEAELLTATYRLLEAIAKSKRIQRIRRAMKPTSKTDKAILSGSMVVPIPGSGPAMWLLLGAKNAAKRSSPSLWGKEEWARAASKIKTSSIWKASMTYERKSRILEKLAASPTNLAHWAPQLSTKGAGPGSQASRGASQYRSVYQGRVKGTPYKTQEELREAHRRGFQEAADASRRDGRS